MLSEGQVKNNRLKLMHVSEIFVLFKEFWNRSIANAYMSEGFLIYEDMHKIYLIYCMMNLILLHGFAPDPSPVPS